MDTPICDFVQNYLAAAPIRFHMPGHKGRPGIGMEARDITEIPGADSLYEAAGIIRQSEANASRLFGVPTFYSAEGSSLCIRAMLYLARLWALREGRALRIAAGRNAHRTFLSALALLGLEADWLVPAAQASYLACPLTAEDVEKYLAAAPEKPAAVYLTDPDYLGNRVPLQEIAAVCRCRGVPLLVDGAHAAYLKFLPGGGHPADAGADLCCASAHKTLPVLTGGAYLHLARGLPDWLRDSAKDALALFGSTSPSYLILQSLDAANARLAGDWPARLAELCGRAAALRARIAARGIPCVGDEPGKLTLTPRAFGWRGDELAAHLANSGIWCEFADPDFTVFLFSPDNDPAELELLERALTVLPRRAPLPPAAPVFSLPERVLSVREAMLAPFERLPVEACLGRVLGPCNVACPPAVPILMPGERIGEAALAAFAYYGIRDCAVVRQDV